MLMILPDILSESEEGFADLVLAIVEEGSVPGGGRCLDVHATHEGELVGVRVELPREWKPGGLSSVTSFAGVITYRSMGDISDRFVSLLDRLYGAGLDPTWMNDAVAFAALALGDDPGAIESAVVDTKLFFEHKDEGRYAELYTNVDVPRAVVQIREKDPHYRRAIIRALARGIA